MTTNEMSTEEPATFIEYGISYKGEPPRRWTWMPEYDRVMNDLAHRLKVHPEIGPIVMLQRTVTITATEWEPAVRPDFNPEIDVDPTVNIVPKETPSDRP